jgi:hypothetical protein
MLSGIFRLPTWRPRPFLPTKAKIVAQTQLKPFSTRLRFGARDTVARRAQIPRFGRCEGHPQAGRSAGVYGSQRQWPQHDPAY